MPEAQSKKSPDKRGLVEDDIVQRLRPDLADKPIEFHLIEGWVGRSPIEGMWRLYPTPDLDEFIEIRDDDILGRWPLEGDQVPLGGSSVAIRADAELMGMGSSTVTARAAAMLGGDLIREFTAAVDPAILAASYDSVGTVYNRNYTKGFLCGVSMFFACTTHVVRNPTCTKASGKLCGTRRFLP